MAATVIASSTACGTPVDRRTDRTAVADVSPRCYNRGVALLDSIGMMRLLGAVRHPSRCEHPRCVAPDVCEGTHAVPSPKRKPPRKHPCLAGYTLRQRRRNRPVRRDRAAVERGHAAVARGVTDREHATAGV